MSSLSLSSIWFSLWSTVAGPVPVPMTAATAARKLDSFVSALTTIAIAGFSGPAAQLSQVVGQDQRHKLCCYQSSTSSRCSNLPTFRCMGIKISLTSWWVRQRDILLTRGCFLYHQPWLFIGRTNAETSIFWPPDMKSWHIGKDHDAGKDWRQEEKGTKEDEMVGWHHQCNGHKFEQILVDGEGERSLVCCNPWCHKESDVTEQLNNNRLKKRLKGCSHDADITSPFLFMTVIFTSYANNLI